MSDKYSKGHPYLDAYRHWHKTSKTAPKNAYGTDIDFVLVSFGDDDSIKGIIDFKRGDDNLTSTEKTVYTQLINLGLDVYIVKFYGNFEKKRFARSGHPQYGFHERVTIKDKDINKIKVTSFNDSKELWLDSAKEYWEWEKTIRA